MLCFDRDTRSKWVTFNGTWPARLRELYLRDYRFSWIYPIEGISYESDLRFVSLRDRASDAGS